VSLAAWQRDLTSLIVTGAAELGADLTDSERGWLGGLRGDGLVLTRTVLRGWRAQRVGMCAPVTIAALGERAAELVDDYLRRTRPPSSFIVREGLQFLDTVGARSVDLGVAHLDSILALERALLVRRLHEATPSTSTGEWLARHPAGAVIGFRADLAVLLRALLCGGEVPAEGSGEGVVLVAPGLDAGMRLVDPEEAALFALLERPRRRWDVPPLGEDVVDGLLAVGALRRCVDPAEARLAS
jgi:hypothetical protein